MLQLISARFSSVVRRTILVASCSFGLALGAHAQQAPTVIRLSPEDQQRGLNGVQKNFFFTISNGSTEAEYQSAGFFGQRLRPYLAGNEEALDNLNRYRRQKWLFLAERLTFVGAVGLYSQQVLALDEKQQYFNNTQKAAAGIALASLLSNVLISRNTNSHFQRAVEAYNAGHPAARTGAVQLRPSAVGLTASRTGHPLVAFTWNLR
ncbi:hypothetical protein HNQ93_000562 [Hymenobacter luteus]|uniref:DUF5683 domain-containing protein n=2 Tax=Hymenobacter TaxID=89966 RepID=A0A7W9SXI1_9BACT|nr:MULTISPECIES: hypothetical protein [Hymenobacter]MBB4599958.1 hypothetical protein [Hymenobacter latericoloratus]MBB6057732.1 hypothetical protein [Hymenobacter luteus]